MYRVLIERSAEKDLGRLEADVRRRVIGAIRDLATDPRPAGCRRLAGVADYWRVRVGDCRILYAVADDIRVVAIRQIRHRREVYRD